MRHTLRQGLGVLAIGALLACGNDGPVGPSGTTTTTTVATTSTTTAASTTTTAAPTTTTSIPIFTISTTTTSIPIFTIPTTTTTAAVSFAATVRPHMTGTCDGCHLTATPTLALHYSAATVYNWAIARSIANNPGGSLFLQKPSGAVAHGGGTVPGWGAGGAGNAAATAWINGGRGV